jgi:hypothetical protein
VIVVMPLSARTASKAAVYLQSRSRIRLGHAGVGVLQVQDPVSGHLRGPGGGGVSGGAEDAEAPGGMFDDGTDEQPGSGQGGVSMKSAASRACAWPRRKLAQLR